MDLHDCDDGPMLVMKGEDAFVVHVDVSEPSSVWSFCKRMCCLDVRARMYGG